MAEEVSSINLEGVKCLAISTTCPWCGKKGGTKPVIDCAHVKHYFHEECDKKHREWMKNG